jgi:hypothetical protein
MTPPTEPGGGALQLEVVGCESAGRVAAAAEDRLARLENERPPAA